MKNYIRATIGTIAVFTVALTMSLSCFAFDNASNTESMDALRTKANGYYEKVAGTTTEAESSTYNAVKVYIDRIDILRQATDRDTSEEMALEGKRGASVGILSWIYYSHKAECESDFGESWRDIEAEYEKQRDVINRAQKDFFEGNGVTVCYTRLLTEIYSRKIEALRVQDSGNGKVSGIIDEALRLVTSRCAYSESFGEDAENCRIYFAEVTARVDLQRFRDSAEEELRAVAGIICPDAEPDTGVYSDFFSDINEPDLEESYLDGKISDREVQIIFNRTLCDAVVKILRSQETGGRYRVEYYRALSAAVTQRVEKINSESVVTLCHMGDLFADHARGLAVAEAKDAILLYADSIGRDASLDIILLEYTGANESGGIFDNAQDIDRVSYELLAAKMRCVWYDRYRGALSSICQYLGEGSDKSREARVLYYAVDGRIKAGERHGGEDILENLAVDISELCAVVDRAEAERFTLDHGQIIEKTQVGVGDKDALCQAIEASVGLSAGARSYLSQILRDIGEKYKRIAIIEIDGTLSEDAMVGGRREAVNTLVSLVEALNISGEGGQESLSSLRSLADGYVEKAINIKLIFDSYCYDYLPQGNKYFGAEVESLVSDTVRDVISLTDREEESVRVSCVLWLKRFASLEEIYVRCEGYEDIGDIPTVLESARGQIESCRIEDEINSYRTHMIGRVSEIIRLYEYTRAVESIEGRVNTLKAGIGSYLYISPDTRKTFLSRLDAIRTEVLSSLALANDGAAVIEVLDRGLASLASLDEQGGREELSACHVKVLNDLNTAFGKAEYYSVENFAQIVAIIEDYTARLDLADNIDQYERLGQEGVAKILEVEDLLRVAKREAREAVEILYNTLMERAGSYSEEGLATLSEIYGHTLAELDGYTSILEDTPHVRLFADERMALMRGVRLSVIYTADGLLSGGGDMSYPEGYDLTESGYIGALRSADGIPSDIELVIRALGVENISEVISNAAKKKMILSGSDRASSEIIRSLKRCSVLLGMEISLGDILPSGGKYLVSVLLPRDIDPSEVLGVVFIRDDGAVEFFEVGDTVDLLKFETTHFSKFYVVGEQDVDLLPLIICLSIIVFCELCVLALLIIRRKRLRERFYGLIPAPFALAVGVRPVGGNFVAIALGGAAICLGASIAYLLYLELRDKKKRSTVKPSVRSLVRVGGESAVVSKNDATDEKCEVDTQTEAEAAPRPESEQPREIMASVSAEAAESLMSDVEAKCIQQKNAGYEDTEIYHGERKSEINIDIISQNFQDGDTVTLNSLKEKKLIPQSAGQVKILARGVLDKRLRVVAQDFSGAALKMILLTGGEAIVTYSASERGGKRKF